MKQDFTHVKNIYIICGKTDMRKGIDGFAMLYKRLDQGKLQWPRNEKEVRKLTQQELRWLLEGLSIQQPKAISTAKKSVF